MMTNAMKSNNKRIAKNTVFLYVRMILVMFVSLFTSRIVLQTLGVEDYGIYNVVGGVASMLVFLNSTLSSTCQRYFSYELGRNNHEALAELFKQNITLFVFFVVCVLFLAETIGVWFINSYLEIPEKRRIAMNWVFQFSLLTFVVSSITIPYNALIICHERMSVFALISLIEVGLKLSVALLIGFDGFDRLIFYAGLMFLSSLIIAFTYYFYCRRFPESRYSYCLKSDQVKKLISYSGWHFLGSLSVVIREQGVNILLNIFFTPAVNAARAIAYQVSNAVNGLTRNFLIAVKPQIYKLYGTNELQQMHLLIARSSKMGFILVAICAFPVILNTDVLLYLWLGQLPDNTVLFTQLVLVNSIIQSIDVPSIAAALATDRIKVFEIVTGGLMIFNLPISYLFLRYGYNPEITIYVSIVLSYITIIIRAYLLENLIYYKALDYLRGVVLPLTFVGITVVIPAWFIGVYINSWFLHLIITTTIFILTLIVISYLVLLNPYERKIVIDYSRKMIRKLNGRCILF
ncbi:lipopolysaccharide biosynthesis protein [uncultured Parabacteroides sp.]|uniref:lipopolysaccharide biosynthesis protein n=1 Tax=uncultured Parabacteroides sp. TaxID=512312 RepID=UPI00260AD85A|nr:lipopolysaccharide biosynthesis protein [uncultured Parabacteroides sp.]